LIPLYQLQSFLAWRKELVNVENNPAPEGRSGTLEAGVCHTMTPPGAAAEAGGRARGPASAGRTAGLRSLVIPETPPLEGSFFR
jgi:hypothetical protein